MFTLVIYDITENNLRLAAANACKKYGLIRVQKSAFLGEISNSLRKELAAALKEIVKNTENNIQIYVICRADLSHKIELGKPYKGEESDLLM